MERGELRRIRVWVGVLIVGLVVSGVTAFALQGELQWLVGVLGHGPLAGPAEAVHLLPWLERVLAGVTHPNDIDPSLGTPPSTNARYPFLAYGTDWLAFAHLVIAVAFVGLWTDPVRNRWLITFGLIACGGVVPLALIAGQVRGIPWGWRMIDCSFGVVGCLPLVVVRRMVGKAGTRHQGPGTRKTGIRD